MMLHFCTAPFRVARGPNKDVGKTQENVPPCHPGDGVAPTSPGRPVHRKTQSNPREGEATKVFGTMGRCGLTIGGNFWLISGTGEQPFASACEVLSLSSTASERHREEEGRSKGPAVTSQHSLNLSDVLGNEKGFKDSNVADYLEANDVIHVLPLNGFSFQ